MMRHMAPLFHFLLVQTHFIEDPAQGCHAEFFPKLFRFFKHPYHHQIGIGIIFQSAFRGIAVFLVKLIGAHDPVDAVASCFRIKLTFACPEARDVEEQLEPCLFHKLFITGDIIIIPGVVCYGEGDVTLQ